MFGAMFGSHRAVMLLIDPATGAIVDANNAALEFYGHPLERMRNLRIQDINRLPPAGVELEMRNAVTERRSYFVFPHLLADGKTRWVEVYSSPVVSGERTLLFSIIHDITERKRLEEALARSEDLMRETGLMARVGGWELDLVTKMTQWTEETYTIHEVEAGERPALEDAINFYAPEARPVIQEAVARAIADGTPYDLELPFITARGRKIWVRTQGRADTVDDRAVRLHGTFQDITERKHAEMERERLLSEVDAERSRLKAIFEASRSGIFLEDESGLITFANRSMAEMFRCSMDDFLGTKYPECIHPDEREDADRIVNRLISGDMESASHERHFVRCDGSEFWGVTNKRRMTDGNGRFVSLVGTVTDITERIEAGKALRESEEIFRQIAENSQDIFWLLSADLNSLLYLSPAYERIWQKPVAEAYKRPLSRIDLVHREDHERVRKAIKSVDSSGLDVEFRIVRPDGAIRWIWARNFPIRDGEGKTQRVLGVARDITERKRLEAELGTIEKLEAVGVLAGGIAHDFNNLLTGIMGNISLARIGLTAENPITKFLEESEKACLLAKDLSFRLLTFSRGGAPVKSVIKLNELIFESVALP